MQNIITKLARLFALPLAAAAALAADVDRPMPATGGLHVGLGTSGYKFVASADKPEPATLRRAAHLEPGSKWQAAFAAGAVVHNRSRTPIAFTFPDGASAALKWKFRVLDSEGNEVWHSDEDVVGTQALESHRLAPGKSWRRVVRVPLVIDGAPLKPGIYTLEAALAADKPLSATSIFEVVAPPPPPGDDTGISGLVLKSAPDASTDPTIAAAEVPAAGAIVHINQIVSANTDGSKARVPFNWVGRADDEGRFKVNTPAGKFRVTAMLAAPEVSAAGVATTAAATTSVEVTVEAGHFTEITIHLKPTPPPTRQGIKGTVLLVSSNASESPLAGASVVIEQMVPAGPMLPAFHWEKVWQGFTDEAGRFTALTREGQFRVTASGPPTANLLPGPPPVTVEVSVKAGQFSEVTLRLIGPTPGARQGIEGTVLIGPISPVEQVGVPNEKPLAGARVVIEQIATLTAAGTAAFRWTGTINEKGRFEVATPPGRFRVTASQPSNTSIAIGHSASVEVTVESGHFAAVTLHIDSGIR